MAAGWHQATVREAQAHREAIQAQMGEWFIAECVDGKVAGPGYGGSVETCVPETLGHLVILRSRGDTVPDGDPHNVHQPSSSLQVSQLSKKMPGWNPVLGHEMKVLSLTCLK